MAYQIFTGNPHLPYGDICEVWYAQNPHFGFGPDPNPKDLNKTHAHLVTLATSDIDEVYRLMQGENWSPNGEAKPVLEALGLHHTSMSVGDVVIVSEDNLRIVFIVRNTGFELLLREVLPV